MNGLGFLLVFSLQALLPHAGFPGLHGPIMATVVIRAGGLLRRHSLVYETSRLSGKCNLPDRQKE